MKELSLVLLTSALCIGVLYVRHTRAADDEPLPATQFATLRWDGRENSYVVRPNAKVERLRQLFDRYPRQDGVDDRIYYMTIAMNALAKEGFEFAGTMDGQVVMRRGGVH